MKKILLVGNIACGKTTLCQRLNGLKQEYKKTQALEVIHHTIDSPGEYLEHRSYLQALIVTSVDVDVVLFLQDASQDRFMYSPGLASSFPVPVAGVVTKTDCATEKQISQAKELLALAGANPVFSLSAITGEGVQELLIFLDR